MKNEEKNQERYRKIGILVSTVLLVATVILSMSAFETNQTLGGTENVQNVKQDTGRFRAAAKKAELLETAKITDTQASETVLNANQGALVVEVNLENENEVAVYEIIIKTQDGRTVEVLVDAVNNVIVSKIERI